MEEVKWASHHNFRLLFNVTALSMLSIIISVVCSASLMLVLPFDICPFTFFTPNLGIASQKQSHYVKCCYNDCSHCHGNVCKGQEQVCNQNDTFFHPYHDMTVKAMD